MTHVGGCLRRKQVLNFAHFQWSVQFAKFPATSGEVVLGFFFFKKLFIDVHFTKEPFWKCFSPKLHATKKIILDGGLSNLPNFQSLLVKPFFCWSSNECSHSTEFKNHCWQSIDDVDAQQWWTSCVDGLLFIEQLFQVWDFTVQNSVLQQNESVVLIQQWRHLSLPLLFTFLINVNFQSFSVLYQVFAETTCAIKFVWFCGTLGWHFASCAISMLWNQKFLTTIPPVVQKQMKQAMTCMVNANNEPVVIQWKTPKINKFPDSKIRRWQNHLTCDLSVGEQKSDFPLTTACQLWPFGWKMAWLSEVGRIDKSHFSYDSLSHWFRGFTLGWLQWIAESEVEEDWHGQSW